MIGFLFLTRQFCRVFRVTPINHTQTRMVDARPSLLNFTQKAGSESRMDTDLKKTNPHHD
jgi:hypothetical protein